MNKEINVIINDVYIGFRDKDGKLFLQRCPECGKENYAMWVASGQCAWCGWSELLKEEYENT